MNKYDDDKLEASLRSLRPREPELDICRFLEEPPATSAPRSAVGRTAAENIPVAELAKSFGRHGESPKVLSG